MRVIDTRNVCSAYLEGMILLSDYGRRESSRAGDVIVLPDPVCTVYHRPTERVLMDSARDANPFFHLFESLWMLSGSRDATWLDRFVSDFSSRFAEDDGMQHGAYGYRWRHHFESDQLWDLAALLHSKPDTRQAVLTMWDPSEDLCAVTRDLPCNTHAYLRVQERSGRVDLTVCCRSNDIIWGAYGANAVHMSVMGEVVAGLAGMRLGTYRQVSNNFHAYTTLFSRLTADIQGNTLARWTNPYEFSSGGGRIVEGHNPEQLMGSAHDVMSDCESLVIGRGGFQSTFFLQTVVPMWKAHTLFKEGGLEEAKTVARTIGSWDWRQACVEWINRRQQRAGK